MKVKYMKIAICDDEQIFLDKLKELLEKYSVTHQIQMEIEEYNTAEQFLKEISNEYDLILLDVRLDQANGIDVAKELRARKIDSMIIYISAYLEMAPRGYEVQAFRYILKNDLDQVLEYTMNDALAELRRRRKEYEIKTQGQTECIPLANILYFASFKRYVEIYTADRTYKQYRKMYELEQELEEQGFLRIHKSYLVNMRYISYIKNREIYLKDGTVLPCSKKEYQNIKNRYILWEGTHY